MKRTVQLLLCVLFGLGSISPGAALAGDVTTTLAIRDMTCSLCVPAVTRALEQVAGVKSVQVSLDDRRAIVLADETVGAEALVAAVARAGFTATTAQVK